MKLSKSISALGAFLALALTALALAGCGSSVPGNAIASVAGNPITTQAYEHWMFVAAKGNTEGATSAPVIVPTDPPDFSACVKQVRKQIPTLAKIPNKTIKSDCAQLFTSLNDQVMDFLIKSYWYQAEAYKRHVTVTTAQVAKALATAKKQEFPTAAAFQAFLSSSGQTLADITFRVRINQLYTKLLTHFTMKVTPARIAAYYESHPSQFGTRETRNIRIVLANSRATAQAAKAALQAGQSWTVVAKKYSIDPTTKNSGGALVGITQGEEEHALDVAAFSAKLGQLVGPIHGTFGWYVVAVTKITPATHRSLASSTALIRQLLASQSATNSETDLNAAAKKDWGAQTDCRAEYSMTDCKGYTTPKATTTASNTASPTATVSTVSSTHTKTSSKTTSKTSSTSSSKSTS